MEDLFVDYQRMQEWSKSVLMKSGVPSGDAGIISRALVLTSLWGIDSHGIARIAHYLTRLKNGTINPKPVLKLVQSAAATGQLDGDDGHGIVVMTTAAKHAIEIAKASGTGVIGVHNSSHCGAIGLYTRQVTESGMVGIAFTHADALVVPHGGNKPFFGTNPISIAFPTNNPQEPICLDMATSIVPWNFVMNARREKTILPVGVGVDKDGHDSTNPDITIGVKPTAGHKGYGLAFLIDMLCGPLNGMNFGPNMTSMYKDITQKRKLGSLIIAIDPQRFGGRDIIRSAGMKMIEQIRGYGDNVLYPGEPEHMSRDKRQERGIPISKTLIAEFKAWSDELNVPFFI